MKFTVTKKSTLWHTLLLPFFFHFPIGCNNRDGILGNPHGWQIRLNSDSFCSACALVLQYPLRTLSSGSIWWFEAPTLKKWNKVALPLSLNLKILFVSLHASPRVHRSCLSVSSWDWFSNFGACGLTGALNHAKQWTFAHPKFGVPYRALWDSSLCDLVSKLVCLFVKIRPGFRRLDVVKHATQLSCNPHSTTALLFSFFFNFFWADLHSLGAQRRTHCRMYNIMISFNSDIRANVRNDTMFKCIDLSCSLGNTFESNPRWAPTSGSLSKVGHHLLLASFWNEWFSVSLFHIVGPRSGIFRWIFNSIYSFTDLSWSDSRIRKLYKFSQKSYPPHEVDCESSRSPWKSKSRNNPILHCCAVFPTWHLFTATPVSGFWQLNQPNVCQKILSIFWPLERVYTRNRECQIYRCVPDRDISRRFVSKLSTTLLLSPSLSPWTDGRQRMEKRLCTAADLFYSPNRKITRQTCLRTTFHVLWPSESIGVRFPPIWKFPNCSSQNSWFEHVPVIFENIVAPFAFTLSTFKIFGLLSRANAPRGDVRRVLSLQPLPTGPPSSRSSISIPTITGGYSRTSYGPYESLTVHWSVSISASFEWRTRPAGDPIDSDPRASLTLIPTLDRAEPSHSLKPWMRYHTQEPTVLSKVGAAVPSPECRLDSKPLPVTLPVTLAHTSLPPTTAALGTDRWRLSSPYHVSTTYLFAKLLDLSS